MINPDSHAPANSIIDGYSLEVVAKAIPALIAAACGIVPGSTVFIPYLPGETDEARLAAATAVRGLGFEPMLHLSARRISSLGAFESFVKRAVAEANVERCLVVAGDPPIANGPFCDSSSLIDTGIFERSGINLIAVAGHPEGHPAMTATERWEVLERKCRHIEMRGMTPQIVTQFGFDADVVLTWLKELRERGIRHPVRVGVPGPAGVAVLARYAAMCGVRASVSMSPKYGLSIGKLIGRAGPDVFVDRLNSGMTEAHGDVSLHFFPFGGVAQSVRWIAQLLQG